MDFLKVSMSLSPSNSGSSLNEAACRNFCNVHSFDWDPGQTRLFMEILYPINSNADTATIMSMDTEFNMNVFGEIIKARVLHSSKQYDVFVEEAEISNIVNQVDNLISFELFKLKKK